MFLIVNYESLLVRHQVRQGVDAIYGHNVCPSMTESHKVDAHSFYALYCHSVTVKDTEEFVTCGSREQHSFQSSAHLFLNSTSYLSRAGPRACCLKGENF